MSIPIRLSWSKFFVYLSEQGMINKTKLNIELKCVWSDC